MHVPFRTLLRKNFLRRGLRWLSRRAQRRLFQSLLLPSLLPRFPVIAGETEADDLHDATDARIVVNAFEVRVISSAPVSLEDTYCEWIDPLGIGAESIATKIKRAETLPGYKGEGQHFFPARLYLEAIDNALARKISLAHRCRASKYFFSSSSGTRSATPFEPDVLLVYARLTHPSSTPPWARQGADAIPSVTDSRF